MDDVLWSGLKSILLVAAFPAMLLFAGMLAVFVVLGPALLRAALPATERRIKWTLVGVFLLLGIAWCWLRGQAAWEHLSRMTYHAAAADALLVLAWLGFAASCVLLHREHHSFFKHGNNL